MEGVENCKLSPNVTIEPVVQSVIKQEKTESLQTESAAQESEDNRESEGENLIKINIIIFWKSIILKVDID